MNFFLLLLVMTGLLLISLHNMRRYVLLKQRIEKITSPYSNVPKEDFSSKQDIFKKAYIIFAKRVLNYLHVLTIDTTKTFTKRLANAGWLSKNSLIVFLSVQMIFLFSLIFLGVALVLFVPVIAAKPFFLRMAIIIFMMWLGYRIPEWYLSKKTTWYRIKLRRSILEFLDLFLICIEAGFGNDKALERVGSELTFLHPQLCEQVKILITELRIMPNRRDAWDNFYGRTGLEEIKVIVQIIKQSEQLGTSIGQALRAQLEMFRGERLNYIEHKAMRLPTLLTLPLVLFIFPALLCIILGPAILKALEIMGTH